MTAISDLVEPYHPALPDLEYIGDLAGLSPISTRPKLMRFVKGKGGFEPNEDFKTGIEEKINEFFADKGWTLLPQWKNSQLWENFEYMVVLVDESINKSAGKFVYDSVIGLLVAFTIETPSGFKIRYYDKIGVRIDKRGNSYMTDLIKEARKIDLELDQEREPERPRPMPAGLRTSEAENDERYHKLSDYRIALSESNGSPLNQYFVHLFGFKDKDKKPIKPYTNKMYEAAEFIANLASTFKKSA